MSLHRRLIVAAATAGALAAAGLAGATAAHADPTYLSQFNTETQISPAVPPNGDQNPYGVFIVQQSTGRLKAGNILVSDFNNATTATGGNLQGTGRSIVQITPSGQLSVFATIDPAKLPGPCPGGVGLTTALEVLPGGWVVVGSTPSTDGSLATSGAGCLIVLNHGGHVVETISGHGINGPWDSTLAVSDGVASLFVANVLNGTVAANGAVVNEGTVLRLTLLLSAGEPPRLAAVTKVGSRFAEQTSGPSFVLGPTGVGLGADGTLYVADTQDSGIHAIGHALRRDHSAGTGDLVTQGNHLIQPLGLAIAPNGDILTVNGGDGNIVETTPAGAQVDSKQITGNGTGALFGLAVLPGTGGVYFVDDGFNTLNLLH
jgi:sugar lactone lactonase YvrE